MAEEDDYEAHSAGLNFCHTDLFTAVNMIKTVIAKWPVDKEEQARIFLSDKEVKHWAVAYIDAQREAEEKTASAVLNKDGSLHDFGGPGFHGDIFNILQYFHNMCFPDALEWVKNQLNISDEIPYTITNIINVSENDEALKRIKKTIQQFMVQSEKYATFENLDYKNEALSIDPLWIFQQSSLAAVEKFREVTTFDIRNKTMVIKIHDYSGNLISFKWRRLGEKGKWITAKDTHPNKQCLSSIVDKNSPIFIVEGHHDFLTGILLNNSIKSYSAPFNVLMVPTVNYDEFNEHEINLLTAKDVYFLPDLNGDDMSGIDSFSRLAEQIEDISNDVAVISLALFLEEYNGGSNEGKLDLSEAIVQWKDKDSYSFVNLLLYYCDTGLKFDDEGIF